MWKKLPILNPRWADGNFSLTVEKMRVRKKCPCLNDIGAAWSNFLPARTLRSSQIRDFPICYFDKHFVNSSPDNQDFISEQNKKRI